MEYIGHVINQMKAVLQACSDSGESDGIDLVIFQSLWLPGAGFTQPVALAEIIIKEKG